MDVATGDFVGLITSNARHISGQIIPQINFSIPASCLTSLVDFLGTTSLQRETPAGVYMAKKQIHEEWSVNNADFLDIWNLEPPPFDVKLDPVTITSKL